MGRSLRVAGHVRKSVWATEACQAAAGPRAWGAGRCGRTRRVRWSQGGRHTGGQPPEGSVPAPDESCGENPCAQTPGVLRGSHGGGNF